MALPAFNNQGDLPPGIHQATLREVIERFGATSAKRRVLALRLERIYTLTAGTGHVARFIVFGSFILANQTQPRVTRDYRDCRRSIMIANEDEFQVTLERIARFQKQLAYLRQVEKNPANYRASASGFLAEIDRMQLQIREYLSFHPAELFATPAHA